LVGADSKPKKLIKIAPASRDNIGYGCATGLAPSYPKATKLKKAIKQEMVASVLNCGIILSDMVVILLGREKITDSKAPIAGNNTN
jgi:hypothetical protein